MGHQRREVLYLRCRRSALQDHDHDGQNLARCRSHSSSSRQILVPIDTPGVEIVGPMHVFGHDDAPHGHMHIRFTNVRVPEENILMGEGRGFEISQLRLGPGRIHHCMRSIGQAEKALDLMMDRAINRQAFGKQIVDLGKNMETISRARIEIEAMRLMVLKAAKAMDVLGNKEARIWVCMIKAMVPEQVCQIIDQSMQVHGATGICQWSPLVWHVHRSADAAVCGWPGRGAPPCGRPCRSADVSRTPTTAPVGSRPAARRGKIFAGP